ncbi:alpha-D-ribose 1-methylphosphonate 5-triphosphate diphosphatase [Desulfolithobacter dissulfuricans]|uniref:Alpha-D-ribose 1-methylphosphonate 5-triphosphate diphosphatase n=1 Tax=Desulfolithobacter dissulfuricans TaxID=2795293 RepID=A0A915XLT0_9BACT|nr:alpha-D-ribose 1-methylphosphonate 5-triphosphate diphosphatase [Desulfolithobacter dissulfuricans]BCO10406.1 alpha-D-ribose 1-methylphosphonate 5-triphosphate diphosphatase [Desulfolithobacter dissulfuricans]
MQTTILRSTRVLVEKTVTPTDIVLVGGRIREIAAHGSFMGETIDLGSLLVLPGLVDLHSDAVEKEIEPRPGATFPIRASLVELDKKLAMAGITTMFHAVAFNDESITSSRGTEMAAAIIRETGEANQNLLGVDNFIHARFEITSFSSAPVIRELIAKGHVHMLSIMDHTPGQGQFKSIETWKRFHLPTYDLSESRAEAIIRKKLADQELAYNRVRSLLEFGHRHGLVLLSHDDDRPRKIDLIREMGITVSEFPLDVDVAVYAREQGMTTGMGAPNVVRGKSQSGNISARELIREECCDFLCSDYHPSSLLQAAFVLHREMDLDLAAAMAMVSSFPADIAGLTDRGRIAPGLLADLTVVDDRDVPRVVATFKTGEMIYSSRTCGRRQSACPNPAGQTPEWNHHPYPGQAL